jgi:hypothetical protein
MKRSGRGLRTTAAAAALLAGLGTAAQATILIAGGLPGGFTSYGDARCIVTNGGPNDVLLNSAKLLDMWGNTLSGTTDYVIPAGHTFSAAYSSFDPWAPGSCVFDVSPSRGVHATLVYMNNGTMSVIPASK